MVQSRNLFYKPLKLIPMRKALIELIVYIADITKTMKWTSAYYDFCQFIDDAAPTKPKH